MKKRSARGAVHANPTLQDVVEIMQAGFARIEECFDDSDERFHRIETRLTAMETRFSDLEYRMNQVEKRLGALENEVEEMRETLEGIARAVDKDAVTLIDHHKRITHLERARA